MYSLNEADLLWGSLPLYWLLTLMFFLYVLFLKKEKTPIASFASIRSTINAPLPNLYKWGLATLSGILLWLGFPTVPLTPLLFVAFVPLLIIERNIAANTEGPAKKQVFKYAYYAFLLWNILSTYWVSNAALAPGIFAVVVNSFLMYWELSWTWLTLGNAFSEYPSWIQWYEYTGVFGGTLWILLANILAYNIIVTLWKGEKVAFGNALRFTGLIIVPIIASFIMYSTYVEKGESAEVVIIQPNYEPHHEKFKIGESKQIQQFIKLSQQQISETTDYLLFPETSFRGVVTNDFLGRSNALRKMKELISPYPDLQLVMGVSAYKLFRPDEPHTPNIREYDGREGKIFLETYNGAIQMDNLSDEIQFYKKSIFVPGAESFPYGKYLPFFKPLVDQLGGTLAGNGGQAKRSVFKGKKYRVAPVICYESIYGEYCTDYIRRNETNANAIFIGTNDGWWDDTMGHRQHLLFARLRAIETRRSIARSANSGVSAFINQRGDILQATTYETEAAIKGTIQMNDEITFYTRWGDLIARIALFTTILLLLNTFVKGITKKE